MSWIKERYQFYMERIKAGRLKELKRQTLWIYEYAKNYWPMMIFYTVLGMSGTVLGIISGFVSRDLVDIITGYRKGELVKTFAIMIGMAVANILVSQITNYVSSRISMKVDSEIKSDIFAKILETDWESITAYHTGDLLARWNNDAGAVSSGVLGYIPNLLLSIFRFISAFAVVIYNDWTFAIFALIGIPFSLLMSRTLLNRMQERNRRNAAMAAKVSGFNQETFSNLQTIKSFDLVHLYVERLKQLQQDYIDMRLEYQRISIVTSLIMGLVGLLVTYSSYGWGIYRVWSGAISYGTMTMFLGLSGQLTGAVNNLTGMVPSWISLTTSAGRLMDILDMPREDYSHKKEALEFLEKHRNEGISLVAEDLDYTYHTGTEVFQHASFEGHPHETIALVGPSGEGKTTMLRLLLALLRPKGGSVRLEAGGESIELDAGSRSLFSYVPQGNTMFSGTIAENLRNVKQDATEEEIIECLKLACAWDFVEKLPAGINSEIKERGGGFSEGQAQRLSIARALLRKSPILLLDEASSALDVATERKIIRNIMKDEYPRLCIVTTHRPTVLTMCNRVYKISEKALRVLDEREVDQLIHDF